MKLGIVGFSAYVRRAYIPYLKDRSDVEISAICDIMPSTYLEKLISETGYRSTPAIFSNLQTMLTHVNLDAIIVSTPHIYHFEQAKMCLDTDIHVLVDKPLACQSTEALNLISLAKSRGLRLAVGNNRRYERPYQYVKQVLQQKILGEIKLINYLFANSPWYDYSQSWRGDPTLSGGGALIDIGHLAVDMIVWLLECPLKWIYAAASTPDNAQVEQSVLILAEFEPATLVNLTVSYETPKPSIQEELSIYGSQGSIFTRRFRTKRSMEPPQVIEQLRNGEIHQISFTEGPDSSMPLQDFLLGIQDKSPIVSDGESSLLTVEFIDAAYRSLREQKKIDLRPHA